MVLDLVIGHWSLVIGHWSLAPCPIPHAPFPIPNIHQADRHSKSTVFTLL
jgi:hypothetical protein